MIKVSVIVPVYNVEDYLDKCLTSLVNQTLNNIEIIIINDGSQDHSQEIINKFSSDYPQKIVSLYKENGGLSSARNLGIEYATGEYLAFVDSDDFVEPTMMEILYNNAIETQSDIVVCDYFKFDCKKNKVITKRNIPNNALFGQNVLNSKGAYLSTVKSYAWNKLFSKKLFLDYNFTFPLNQHFEDSAIIYNIIGVAKKVSFVEQQLYYYCVNRENQITSQYNDKIFDIFLSCQSIINFYQKIGLYSFLYSMIENICIIHIYARIESLRYCKTLNLKYRFLKKSFKFLNTYFPDWKHNQYFRKRQQKSSSRFNRIREHYILLLLYFILPLKVTRLVQRKKKSHKVSSPYKRSNITNSRLRDLQLIELDILLQFDAICRKHNLIYYLSEGTLLGAVRHNGFIPWDDDLDVSMPRDDYEQFLKIAVDELDEDYHLCSRNTIPQYHLPFAKIVTTLECGFVNTEVSTLGQYRGPFIDIFPLDKVLTLHSRKQYINALILRMLRDMLLFKSNYPMKMSKRRRIYKFISRFCSYKLLHKAIYNISTIYNKNSESKYMANLASSYSQVKQIVPIEAYGIPELILFEGLYFPIPCQAKYILTSIYGNYQILPPISKRTNKHTLTDMCYLNDHIQ